MSETSGYMFIFDPTTGFAVACGPGLQETQTVSRVKISREGIEYTVVPKKDFGKPAVARTGPKPDRYMIVYDDGDQGKDVCVSFAGRFIMGVTDVEITNAGIKLTRWDGVDVTNGEPEPTPTPTTATEKAKAVEKSVANDIAAYFDAEDDSPQPSTATDRSRRLSDDFGTFLGHRE
jgi:hypothetical protein